MLTLECKGGFWSWEELSSILWPCPHWVPLANSSLTLIIIAHKIIVRLKK